MNPWHDTDPRGIGKLARGVESFSSVERSLSEGKLDRELESMQLSQLEKSGILSERRSLHEYVEMEAERAFSRRVFSSEKII